MTGHQEGDDLALNDVSITGSKNTVSAGYAYGGAVYCYYQCLWDHVTIAKTTNSITDTSSPYIYGGAVYSDDYLKWSDVTVKTTANATHGSGGYIYGGAAYFESGYSDEISALRQAALKYYHKPVDSHWHARVAEAAIPTNGQPA